MRVLYRFLPFFVLLAAACTPQFVHIEAPPSSTVTISSIATPRPAAVKLPANAPQVVRVGPVTRNNLIPAKKIGTPRAGRMGASAMPSIVPLADLAQDGAIATNVITWNGSSWAPGTASSFTPGGDLSGTSTSQIVQSMGSGAITVDANNPGLQYTYQSGGRTPFIGVSGPASDLAPNTFFVTGSDAFPGATINTKGGGFAIIPGQGASASGSGGDTTLVANAPTAGGAESHIFIDRNFGTHYFAFGGLTGFAASDAALWMGVNLSSLTASNPTIFSDGSNTDINGTATAGFTLGGNNVLSANLSFGSVGVNAGYNLALNSLTANDAGGGVGILQFTKATTNPNATTTGSIAYADSSSGNFSVKPPGGTIGEVVIGHATVQNLSSTGNGAYSGELHVQTTNATPDSTMVFALPANTVGNVTVYVSGKVPSTATGASQGWSGFVTNNAGTCAVMTTNGTFALQGLAASTGTVAGSPISVALSGCNVAVTVTGVAATTFNWSSTIQYAAAGGS